MAQPMGLGEPQRPARVIGHRVHCVELFQHRAVGGVGPRPLAAVLVFQPQKQIPRIQLRVGGFEPVLLFGDDVDDGLLHQDGRDDPVDFGLLIAQPGHERRTVGLAAHGTVVSGNRLKRVVVEHEDFGGAPPGQRLQQPHPRGLRIAQARQDGQIPIRPGQHHLGLGIGGQHVQVGQHALQIPGRIPSQVAFTAAPARSVQRRPQRGVGQRGLAPPGVAGGGGRFGGVIVHERVERLGLGLQAGHGARGQTVRVGGGLRGAQILQVIDEHLPQPIGIGTEQGVVEVAVAAGEPAQLRSQIAAPVGDRGPGQQIVGQGAAQPEPQSFTQPGRFDAAQPDRLVVAGFMIALRNPRISTQIPDVMRPPRGLGAAHRHAQVQMLDQVADVAPRTGRGQPVVAPFKHQRGLPHHLGRVQLSDADRRRPGATGVLGDCARQRAGQPAQQRRLDLAQLLIPAQPHPPGDLLAETHRRTHRCVVAFGLGVFGAAVLACEDEHLVKRGGGDPVDRAPPRCGNPSPLRFPRVRGPQRSRPGHRRRRISRRNHGARLSIRPRSCATEPGCASRRPR